MVQVDLEEYGGNRSEVARLLRQIQMEYESARSGLSGLSVGSTKHEFITHKMERVCGVREELEKVVGEEASWDLVIQTLSEVPLGQQCEQASPPAP